MGSAIECGEEDFYRVIGFANGPSPFRIVSDQTVTDPDHPGTAEDGVTASGTTTLLARFTVDPLTRNGLVELVDREPVKT